MNQHYASAKERLEWVHDTQADEGQTDATHITTALDALTEATLALAYEQRTANLIAFYGDGPKVDAGASAYAELNRQITERLGLK